MVERLQPYTCQCLTYGCKLTAYERHVLLKAFGVIYHCYMNYLILLNTYNRSN